MSYSPTVQYHNWYIDIDLYSQVTEHFHQYKIPLCCLSIAIFTSLTPSTPPSPLTTTILFSISIILSLQMLYKWNQTICNFWDFFSLNIILWKYNQIVLCICSFLMNDILWYKCTKICLTTHPLRTFELFSVWASMNKAVIKFHAQISV